MGVLCGSGRGSGASMWELGFSVEVRILCGSGVPCGSRGRYGVEAHGGGLDWAGPGV